jgi:hypothetical protein
MRKQYTRIYYHNGQIAGLATQDTPFKPHHEPLGMDGEVTRINVAMDLDDPDHVDAQKILDEIMIDAIGRVKIKVDKPAKERPFTLRKVYDTNGNEVPHR